MNIYEQPKIDFHAHIFPGKIVEKAVKAIGDFYSFPMEENGTPETLLSLGKVINTRYYVVHSVATTPRQVISINDFIASEQAKHEEFVGFATLHPLMENLEEEIERVISLGLHGVKIHPDFQAFALDSEESIRMFKLLEGRLPVLIHTGDCRYQYSNPVRMARALDACPGLVAIGAHFGGYSEWDEAKKYLIGRENFYIDTSSALFKLDPEEACSLIREHGVDRTLFGTDYPMWTPEGELERFKKMPLSETEQKAVLFDNAKRLLNLS